MWSPKNWFVRLLVVVAALAVPSVAVAYWTGAWTGTAVTKLAEVVPVVLSPGTVSDLLSPGHAGDVYVVLSNPNSVSVRLPSFVLDTNDSAAPITVDAGHSGCDVSALTFTSRNNGGAGWSVPPAIGATDGTLTVELLDAVAMSSSAANACQGAQFSFLLDVGP